MPRVTVSLKDAEVRSVLPEGTYECSVHEVRGPTKGPKASYLTFIFNVDEDGEYEGRKIFHNTPVEGAGAGMFEELFEKLTGEPPERDASGDFVFDTDDLIGLTCSLVVKLREYPDNSGEYVTDVKKILRA